LGCAHLFLISWGKPLGLSHKETPNGSSFSTQEEQDNSVRGTWQAEKWKVGEMIIINAYG